VTFLRVTSSKRRQYTPKKMNCKRILKKVPILVSKTSSKAQKKNRRKIKKSSKKHQKIKKSNPPENKKNIKAA
jgi:hypothetical protein